MVLVGVEGWGVGVVLLLASRIEGLLGLLESGSSWDFQLVSMVCMVY